MPLIACPECTHSVSSLAEACPHCGYPVRAQHQMPEQRLLVTSPRFFNGNGLMHVPAFLLSFVLVGLLVYLAEWIRIRGIRLIVTNQRTIFVDGILDKHTSEVHHADVRNVQVQQTFFQRIFNTGDLELSSAAQSGIEISARGLPNPKDISKLIWEHRQAHALD